MTQVVAIHGGDAYDSYEEYLTDLRTQTITSLDYFRGGGWRSGLQAALGEAFDVLLPRMPNSANAKYLEWEIVFSKIVPLLSPGCILIGHSLGGIFLAKYLSEHSVSFRPKGVFLIAAPYNTPTEHPLADFVLTNGLENFQTQAERIFLYHSTDDAVVPYSNVEAYMRALPNAVVRTFHDRNHFNQSDFPELTADIRAIAT